MAKNSLSVVSSTAVSEFVVTGTYQSKDSHTAKAIREFDNNIKSAKFLQSHLIGICIDVVRLYESGSTERDMLFPVQQLVDHIKNRMETRSKYSSLQGNSILLWLTTTAKFRVSKNGIVRLQRSISYDREWIKALRDAPTWIEVGKAKQDAKPIKVNWDQPIRLFAEWLELGAYTEEELMDELLTIMPSIKAMRNNDKFMDKIEEKKEKLDSQGLGYVSK